MAFIQKKWKNDKSGKTPIDADELNRMEQGIANAVEKNSEAVLTNVVSRNLFDGMVEKGAFNDSGNKIEDVTQLRNASVIEVKSNTKYIASNNNSGLTLNFFEYDSSKTFIKKTTISSGNSLTTSPTTKYINFCRTSFNLNKMQIEEGTTITSYIPYLNLQESNIDTGWNTLASYGSYRRIGKFVTIRAYINGQNITLSKDQSLELGYLPTEIKPISQLEVPIIVVLLGGTYNTQCVLSISNETGRTAIINRGSSSLSIYGFRIYYTFPID